MKSIDIHQANVVGLGAEKFADALIDQVVNCERIKIKNIYLNKKSIEKEYHNLAYKLLHVHYILGIFSRLVEILFWRFSRNQENEILVLGDLPLNTKAKQYILCHQSLMFKNFPIISKSFFQFFLFRIIFKAFIKEEDIILVQSQEMADNISKTFGHNVNIRIIDISSKFFGWPNFFRTQRENIGDSSNGLRLFYPSAYYPHKNHYLLNGTSFKYIDEIILTLDKGEFQGQSEALTFIGRVKRNHIYDLYKEVDALLFLSSNESLGLPILEAVKCNLPIICPNAEYTRNLSPANCFLFEANNPKSLENAISRASEKILSGWWPKWSFEEIINHDSQVSIEEILLDDKANL